MDFRLSEEQSLFQSSVRGFAERHLKEAAVARARDPRFPWEVARLCAEQGLLGITIPETDGGQGGSLMDAIIAIEEVAQLCPRSADAVQAGNFGPIRTLSEYGTAEQKGRLLPPLLAGEGLIALAMSEPEAGSAVTDLKTTAVADGEGYRVQGSKVFTSNSADATLFLAYVRFGPGTGGIGSVLIERGAEGLSLGQSSHFMNGEEWRALYFDDLYVAPENVLLGLGGFRRQIAAFNVERLGNTARALAVARCAFGIAREHALERHQFGRPLCEFQGLQWKFADMQIKLDAGQLLLYRAAAGAENGLPSAQDTAIAKAFCNQAGFEICNEALQVMGGAGYSSDSLVEYCFRKTRGWMIAGGSLEMMKNRIAEGVFGRRFPQRPPSAGAAEEPN